MAGKTLLLRPGSKTPELETDERLAAEETQEQIVDELRQGRITTLSEGRKTITTAGTREALVASLTLAKYVIITAETDNTGIIAVGGPAVIAALATRTGIPLLAGDSLVIKVDNLAKVFLDTTVSGDGVTYMVLL